MVQALSIQYKVEGFRRTVQRNRLQAYRAVEPGLTIHLWHRWKDWSASQLCEPFLTVRPPAGPEEKHIAFGREHYCAACLAKWDGLEQKA